MALNAYARSAVDRIVVPVGRGLVAAGATPNWMTFFGLVLTLAGVAVVLSGRPVAGAVVVALGGALDALDGTVARLRGSSSAFGAFYDSVTDRIADAAIFGAAAWLVRDDPLLFTVAIVAFAGAQVTSYVRAKAESLGWNATVGLMERAERLGIMLAGFAFGWLAVALWIVAVGGVVTVAQRVQAVLRQAGAPVAR